MPQETYTTVEGDTLDKISLRHNSPYEDAIRKDWMEEVAKENPFACLNAAFPHQPITPGTQLKLPETFPNHQKPHLTRDDKEYVTRPGDNLNHIAYAYMEAQDAYLSEYDLPKFVEKVRACNNDYEIREARPTKPLREFTHVQLPPPYIESNAREYTVAQGDTWESIAKAVIEGKSSALTPTEAMMYLWIINGFSGGIPLPEMPTDTLPTRQRLNIDLDRLNDKVAERLSKPDYVGITDGGAQKVDWTPYATISPRFIGWELGLHLSPVLELDWGVQTHPFGDDAYWTRNLSIQTTYGDNILMWGLNSYQYNSGMKLYDLTFTIRSSSTSSGNSLGAKLFDLLSNKMRAQLFIQINYQLKIEDGDINVDTSADMHIGFDE